MYYLVERYAEELSVRGATTSMAGMALAAPPAACGSAVTSLFAQGGGKIGENREEKAQRWPIGNGFCLRTARCRKGL